MGMIERWLAAACTAAMPLALAVTLLLCLQWPLRDAAGWGSTQANDLAQWLFALYVAAGLRHAHARHAHLVARPDLARRGGRWRRTGAALAVLPWPVFLAFASAPALLQSLQQLERFPETSNPGYFMIRVAMMLMALLLAAESLLELWRAWRPGAVPS